MGHRMRLLLTFVLATVSLFTIGMMTAIPAPAQVYIAPSASTVYLRAATQVYAGPGSQYPRVEYAPPGRSVHLHGCLTSHDWCDVSTSMNRGWVPSQALAVYRNQQYYDLSQSRGWFAYPLLTFTFDRYWSDHYRNRDWYRDRDRYRHSRPWDRPGFDPRHTDRRWNDDERRRWRNEDRDSRREWRQRDRNNDGRPDWQDRTHDRRPGDRDYRGLPRGNDGNRDYRGLPRRGNGVGNTAPRTDVPSPDVRRPPRTNVPPPDVRRPRPDVPPPDVRRSPVELPEHRGGDRRRPGRASEATQVE